MMKPAAPPDDGDDWEVPHESAYPSTSDSAAVSAEHLRLEPHPDVPAGSAYSRKRNKYRTPEGVEFDAGAYRPLPPDRNMYDSQDTMNFRTDDRPRPAQPVNFVRPSTRLRKIGA